MILLLAALYGWWFCNALMLNASCPHPTVALQTPVEVPMTVPVPTPKLVPTPFDIQVPQMVGVLPLS